MAEEVPDLLIFSKRAPAPAQKALEQVQQQPISIQTKPPVQQAVPQVTSSDQNITKAAATAAQSNPKAEFKKVMSHIHLPGKKTFAEEQAEELSLYPESPSRNDLMIKTTLTSSESLKLAKGQFCANHPWRHAYAVCSVCKFPYCYVDVMQDQGRFYCLNDVKQAIEQQNTDTNPAMNAFSIVSSVIFIANSVVLGYFMYPQAKLLATNVLSNGITSFISTISNTYYFPIGNIAIVLLGVVAALLVVRKSIYGFLFSLILSFSGLLLILYEYLYTSVPYLFVSSILLLLSLASLVYSRMSSSHEVIEDKTLTPDIDWPKPETY